MSDKKKLTPGESMRAVAEELGSRELAKEADRVLKAEQARRDQLIGEVRVMRHQGQWYQYCDFEWRAISSLDDLIVREDR